MGMKSDISYQNRINLAQQEISVIRKILESQKSILRKLVLAQGEQHTQEHGHPQPYPDAVRTAVDEPTVRAIRRRNRYDDDDDRDDDDRNENLQQDYKDWSRLSATDPRGLRMLLFRECAALLRGASQDFEEYEFQAGSLEQMVRSYPFLTPKLLLTRMAEHEQGIRHQRPARTAPVCVHRRYHHLSPDGYRVEHLWHEHGRRARHGAYAMGFLGGRDTHWHRRDPRGAMDGRGLR